MKKVIYLTLAACLLLGLAVGCGSASTSTSTSTVAPTKVAASTVETTKTSATVAPAISSGSDELLNKMKVIQSFSADMTVEGAGEKMEGKIALSKSKMRMDMTAAGVNTVMIVDQEKKTAYLYSPEEKTALSMPYAQAESTPGNINDMFNVESTFTVPPKKQGEETVDGKTCVIYEFTTAAGTSKNWLDKATGFPVKSESIVDGKTASVHFTNIKIGNIDESAMMLPADTKIQDMSSLMSSMATPTE